MSRRILILSGPTHEYLDPVRFIGNASSGKMGAALANAARSKKWDIDFITGPVHPSELPELDDQSRIHKVISASEMLHEARKWFVHADVVLFAAAVADYTPVQPSALKYDHEQNPINLSLAPTVDIAAYLSRKKKKNQITIGFALQTHDAEQKAIQKRIEKNLNAIVLNSPEAIGKMAASYKWIDENGSVNWKQLDKTACAIRIISRLSKMRQL
ncbi:MAG TPA: hypothetical protein DD620_00795 [Verrucomicrobia bacterium]|nr:hypothetical protein [Verrucomicrobiota bacterium]